MSILFAFVASIPLTIVSVVFTIWYAVHKREGVSAEFSLCPFRFSLRTFNGVGTRCSGGIPRCGDQLPPTGGEPVSAPRRALKGPDSSEIEKRVGALPPPLGER